MTPCTLIGRHRLYKHAASTFRVEVCTVRKRLVTQTGLICAPPLTPFHATCLYNQTDSTFYMLQSWWRQHPPTRLTQCHDAECDSPNQSWPNAIQERQKIKKVISNWCYREMREEYSWKYNLALQRNSSWALDSTCTVKQSEHLDPFLCG